MALATACQTPGAEYSIHIYADGLSVQVKLPMPLEIGAEGAAELEINLHNAVELVLARYF
jgi:hypothetical protein